MLFRSHSTTVALHCLRLGAALGLSKSELTVLKWSAFTHDLGEVLVATGDSAGLKKAHHAHLCARFFDLPSLQAVAQIIQAHHARWDEEERSIPTGARILAVADTYEEELGALAGSRTAEHSRLAWAATASRAGRELDPAIVALARPCLEVAQ